MENKELAVVEKQEITLGSIAVDPKAMISLATEKAKMLADVIKDRKLYSNISGKNYVRVEGWSTLGAMIGVLPRELSVSEKEDGDVEATVELIRVSDGAVVGRGSAIVGKDEKTWATRPRYARRSMAITRATGKAYRLGFSWIMSLAGYETTPAEEIEGMFQEVHEQPKPEVHSDDPALEKALNMTGSDRKRYGDCTNKELQGKKIGLEKGLAEGKLDNAGQAKYQEKLEAIALILKSRAEAGA